ncbi:MAG: methyltransferase domain-containing protein [Kiritimatiellae bacterium]|nr:methyltransferase domain-containing protein [Kiritimatiellia bacterium]
MSNEPTTASPPTETPAAESAPAVEPTPAVTEDSPAPRPQNDAGTVAALRQALFALSPLRRKQAAMLAAAAKLPKNGKVLLLLPDEGVALDFQRLVAEADPPSAESHQWACVAFSEVQREFLRAAGVSGADAAPLVQLPAIPAAEGELDSLVVSECLEYVDTPSAFMKELHRVLKPKTQFVLHVRRRRSSLVEWLRRMAGLVDASRPEVHDGFTPTELFDALKDGFDIEERMAYGRFFTELATVLAELFSGVLPQSTEPQARQVSALQRARIAFICFTPLFWMSRLLDAILFFLPAHHLVIRAKRRMLWASRIPPRMRDGRTLAEVVLTGRIGTAVGK